MYCSNIYEKLKKTKTINEWARVIFDNKERNLEWAVPDKFDNDGKDDAHRTEFQHDVGRIIHSKAFRRLKHKTQVFISYEKDHYRTRLTHTMEVFQLATSIARTLGLNEDLTAAVSLGHDLGHTPFGHAGESTLNEIMSGECEEINAFIKQFDKICFKNINKELRKRKKKLNFGFKHNYHSLRSIKIGQIVVSSKTKEGILKHSDWFKIRDKKYRELFGIEDDIDLGKIPSLEGQVVDWCDEISQRCHDLDDGIRSGLIEIDNMYLCELINGLCENEKYKDKTYVQELKTEYRSSCKKKRREKDSDYLLLFIKCLVNLFVSNLLECSIENIKKKMDVDVNLGSESFVKRCKNGGKKERYPLYAIQLDGEVKEKNSINYLQNELEDFLKVNVYHSGPSIVREERAAHFIINLFMAYLNNPLALSDKTLKRYYERLNEGNPSRKVSDLRKMKAKDREKSINAMRCNIKFWEVICDHISGMTDDYAQDRFERFYTPFKMVTND
jgi:dGTPase